MLPHPAHSRQVVLQLRELDLQLALGRDGVLGEDVEDQLRPVDDTSVEGVLEVALLRGIELVVDDHAVCSGLREALFQLVELSFPDVRAPRRQGAALHNRADRLDPGSPCQFVHFGELFLGVDPLSQHREDEPALRLAGVWDHRGQYGTRRPRPLSS